MATNKTAAAGAAVAAPAAPTTVAPSRAYLTANVNEDTGEIIGASRFKYVPGQPIQIRFDGKAGVFNIDGDEVIGNSLTFIPVALRVFEDSLFSGGAFHQGRKTWAELFYFDAKGIMCGVLFHGYSVENLLKLNARLFYDDLTFTGALVTVKATKKENKKAGGIYFIAEFSYKEADPAEVQARQEFAEDHDIYRAETVTGEADVRIVSGYRLPTDYVQHRQPARLPASTTAEAAPAA